MNAAATRSKMMPPYAALLDMACESYRKAGPFAYHFARAKLRTDPVYRAILELGLLLGRARVLDLGCGQGLLAVWLRAAELCHERGNWPRDWPPAPRTLSTRGIELMACEVQRARCALGSASEISQTDIRSAAFGSVDAVVILDVLHYLPPKSQIEVLEHRLQQDVAQARGSAKECRPVAGQLSERDLCSVDLPGQSGHAAHRKRVHVPLRVVLDFMATRHDLSR